MKVHRIQARTRWRWWLWWYMRAEWVLAVMTGGEPNWRRIDRVIAWGTYREQVR